MRAGSCVVLCLLLWGGWLGTGQVVAQNDKEDYATLRRQLLSVVEKSPGNASVGIAVTNVLSGNVIFAHNENTLLNPASNAKIVTAAVALKILGPEHRFQTELYGKTGADTVNGALYLKGYGDPTLMSSDLWALATSLKAAGIKRVNGGIVVDDSFFDDENLPFAYDEQPNEDNKFRAPIGAVSVNHNAIEIQIRPGNMAMNKALVRMEPAGYAVVVNDTLTVAQGAFFPKISATGFEDRTRIRVWGNIPLGTGATQYYRRIDNPSLFSGYALMSVLKDYGITVQGDVEVGRVPSGTPLIGRRDSEPLSSVLLEAGKSSNNFVTEMIFKAIGAQQASGSASWSDAIGAATTQLTKWGLEEGSYVFRNGSGLFSANEFSALQLCLVLQHAYRDVTIRPEFLAQLATGGVDGTIGSRYRTSSARRLVRAKTGTLNSVSTLSGYVLDADGGAPLAFSILVNNADGYVAAARSYQEKIVTTIARYLNS